MLTLVLTPVLTPNLTPNYVNQYSQINVYLYLTPSKINAILLNIMINLPKLVNMC